MDASEKSQTVFEMYLAQLFKELLKYFRKDYHVAGFVTSNTAWTKTKNAKKRTSTTTNVLFQPHGKVSDNKKSTPRCVEFPP